VFVWLSVCFCGWLCVSVAVCVMLSLYILKKRHVHFVVYWVKWIELELFK